LGFKLAIEKQSFIDKVLDATPKPALGVLGVMVGFSVCTVFILTIGDLKAPFNRYVDASVTRLEKAVDNLESITRRIEELESLSVQQRVQNTEFAARLKNHEVRIDRLESQRK
jgi:septal ring factor EnvC (AmiA/AmiB activator)